jgi:hypothetical protein
MKKGGAPTGKRLTTVLAEREKREREDPSLKERRHEEDRAKQRRFLASMSGDKPLLTSASTNILTASDAGMHSELSTNILATGAACTLSACTLSACTLSAYVLADAGWDLHCPLALTCASVCCS